MNKCFLCTPKVPGLVPNYNFICKNCALAEADYFKELGY